MVEDTDVVEVRLTLSEDDLERALIQMPEIRWRDRYVLVCFLALLGLSLVDVLVPGPRPRVTTYALLLGTLSFGVLVATRRRRARSHLARVAPGPGERVYRFDEAGLEVVNGADRTRLEYGALRQRVDCDSALLLYVGPGTVHVVPTRALSSDQLQRVRGWLARAVELYRPQRGALRLALLWLVLVLVFLAAWQLMV